MRRNMYYIQIEDPTQDAYGWGSPAVRCRRPWACVSSTLRCPRRRISMGARFCVLFTIKLCILVCRCAAAAETACWAVLGCLRAWSVGAVLGWSLDVSFFLGLALKLFWSCLGGGYWAVLAPSGVQGVSWAAEALSNAARKLSWGLQGGKAGAVWICVGRHSAGPQRRRNAATVARLAPPRKGEVYFGSA